MSDAPDDLVPPGDESAELVLVQVAEDAAVVFGHARPDWMTLQPFLGLTARERADLSDALPVAVGGLNALAQVGPAVAAAQGLVQLSPATLAALQSMTPVVGASGWNLGTLASTAGQFGHSVQWAPAAGAAAGSFVASMGTSIALIAIQVQLAQISRKIDENIALTDEVLHELRWKNEAELVALVRDIRRAYSEACVVGEVTEQIYGEIRGKTHLIDAARLLLMTRIAAYTTELGACTTKAERRKWLTEHAERCLTDLHAVVQIHQAWFVYEAMRAAHVAAADPTDRGAELVSHLRTEAQAENDTAVAEIVGLADVLQRHLGLLEESGAKRLGRFRSAQEARQQASQIRAAIIETVPKSASPTTSLEMIIGDPRQVRQASRMLPLILGSTSRQRLAAGCRDSRFRKSLFFVLEDELIFTTEKAFFDDHVVETRIPTAAVRYALTASRNLDIATSEGFLSITWDRDAESSDIRYADQLLRSLMSLPEDEIRADPRLTASERRRELAPDDQPA